MADKKTEPIRVYVEPELELALRRLADADERKLSAYIRIALKKHVAMMFASELSEKPAPASLFRPVAVTNGPFSGDGDERIA